MSEKDFIEYKELFHDYYIFKECFGETRIMPMDIDGIIEINNKFLVIEFKPDNKSISKGQHITLKKLSMLPNFTVIILWHTPAEQHAIKNIISMQIYPNNPIIKYTNDDAVLFVKNWFEVASKKKA